MSREESDREDLLREATALVERAELKIDRAEEPVVVGFRRNGCASVFFGHDLVFQFNSEGKLRRGYSHGRLVKAERGQLASLRRVRRDNQVQLLRHDLDKAETQVYVDTVLGQLARLRKAFDEASIEIIGQVPADGDVPGRIRRWLDSLPKMLEIAKSPRAT